MCEYSVTEITFPCPRREQARTNGPRREPDDAFPGASPGLRTGAVLIWAPEGSQLVDFIGVDDHENAHLVCNLSGGGRKN